MDALLEPLSPELVLVCPELREAALVRPVAPLVRVAPVGRPVPSPTVEMPASRVPVLVVALIYLALSVVRTVVPAVAITAALALGIGLLS